MKLFIPPLGTPIRLENDWTFTLHAEHRNVSLGNSFGLATKERSSWSADWINTAGKKVSSGDPAGEVTLPKDTILTIDRYYIKRGLNEYDSLTFRIKSSTDIRLKGARFWAKLEDVNKMEAEIIELLQKKSKKSAGRTTL